MNSVDSPCPMDVSDIVMFGDGFIYKSAIANRRLPDHEASGILDEDKA